MHAIAGDMFEAAGWKGGSGGATLGLRFGKENARAFAHPSWTAIEVELDGVAHAFKIAAPFWSTCPEVRGAPITAWMHVHRLAPWPSDRPPSVKMVYLGDRRFRAVAP